MPEVIGASEPWPEPVTAEAIRPVGRPLLTMQWRDLAGAVSACLDGRLRRLGA